MAECCKLGILFFFRIRLGKTHLCIQLHNINTISAKFGDHICPSTCFISESNEWS